MQIIERLQNKISEDRLSVLKISKETGIPAYRIYKWLDGKANPKHEDVQILEKWLSKGVEKLTKEKPPEEPTYDDTRELIKALREHNETLKNQVQSSLTALHAELRSNRELLVSLINGTTARGETIMEFLEELTRQQPGNLVARSDKREIDLQAKHNRKGNKAAADNDGKV